MFGLFKKKNSASNKDNAAAVALPDSSAGNSAVDTAANTTEAVNTDTAATPISAPSANTAVSVSSPDTSTAVTAVDNKHSTDTETVAAKVSSASDPVQHKPRDVAQDSSTSANSKDAGISAANKPIEKSVPSQSAAPATASLNDTDTKISAENDKSKEKIESKATKSLSTSKSVDVVPEKQPGKDERKGTANSADQSASVNKTGDKSTKTTTSASDTGGKPKGNETITPVTGSTEVDSTTKKTEEANKDVSSKTEIPPEKLNPQASTGKEASAVNQIQSVEAKNTKEEGESKKNKSRFSFRRLVGKGESKKKDQNSNASGAIIEDQEKSGAVVGEADAVVEDVNKPVDVPARPTQQQQQPQPQPQADESKEKSALKSDKREKKPEVVGQKIAEKPIVKKSESNPTTAVKDDMTKIEPIKEKEKLLPDKKTPISISDEGVQNEKQISEQEAEVEISSGPQDHEGSEGAVQNDIDKEGEKEALEETFPRFRRNRRQKAELEGHSGGEPVSVLDDNEYALKIQSSWRGKVIRKQIKRQNIAAADIQRVYKGRLDRKKYMQNLQQHNDSARAAKTRQERLKKIRAKEKELRLLSTIPAEDFLNYERIKENNNAKVIQRAWRRTDKSYATIGKESAQSNRRSFDEVEYHSKRAFKTTGYHQPKRKQDGVERPDAKDLPRPYPDSQEKRKEIILSQIISKSEQIATVTPRPDSSSRPTSARERHAVTFDVDALTLAQLHRRISDKATIRNKEREFRGTRSGFRPRANKYGTLDLNDTVQDSIDRATAKSTNIFSKTRQNLQGATEAKRKSHHHSSARQKYQDLSEVQLRASVMMQEHAYAKELMTERQAERLKAIGHCKYLVNKLSNPLSLDEAKKLLTADPKTLEKEDIEKSWYITEESQSYDTSVGQEQIKNAIEIHLKTAQTMRDRDHWGVVTIPLNNNIAHANVAAAIYVDKTLDGTEDAESRKHLKLRDANFVSVDRSLEGFGSRKRNNDGKTFRPLVSDWADGKDVEESMYWITYASQPTKILAPVAKDEVEVADRTASAIVDQSVEAITAARLRVDKNALVKQITHEAMNYPRRRQEISAKLQAESDYIGRKAQQYLDQAINEYHQMKLSKAQEKLSAEMQERQLRAAIRIQALFRGKYNRVKSAKLRSERRVLVALQNLLAEIANNDTQQQVKARRFSTPGTLNQSFSGDRGGPKPHSSLILDYFAKIPDISRSMQAGRAPSLSATEEAGKGKKTADLVAKSKATTSFKVESVNSQKKQPAVDSTWLSSSMRESSILKNAWTSTSPFVPTAFDHQEFNRTPRSTAYEIGESHATTPASEPPGPYSLPYLSAGNTFSPFVHDSQSNKEAIIGSPANYGGIASSAVSEPSSPITARSNRSNLTMEDDHREHKEPRPPSESPSARGKPRGNLKVGSSPVSDRRQASGRQLHSPSSKRVTMLSSIAETEDSLSNPASKTPPEYHTPPKLRIPEEVYDVINSAHSDRLSEYSGGADVLDGYISPPSHSNSRSFGQSSSLQGITIGSRVAGSHVRQDVDLEVSDNSYFSPHKKQGKNIGTGKKVNPLDEDFDDDYLQVNMIATKPIIEIGKEAASELEDLDYISVDIKEADRSISTIMKKAEDAVIRNDARCASFMTGALTADVKSFEKGSAMELLSGIAIVCGPESIVHLLEKVALSIDTQQSVVDEPNRQSTSSSQSMDRVKSIEMDVEHAATALVELGQSLDLLESGRLGSAATASVGQVSANERRVAIASIQVLQLTALLKLLGSASNSGRVKVADVGSLIEDLWVMEVPDYGKLLSWVLAQLRVFIVQQATRIASSPSKVFDETLQAVLHPDGKRATPSQSFEYNAAITIEVAEQILIKYLSVVIGRMSRNSGSRGDTTPIVSHVARSILKMIAKQNFPSVITVMELKSFLCNLCSFRTLQKKLQIWFRAVPSMLASIYDSVKSIIENNSRSSLANTQTVLRVCSIRTFCRACQISKLPTTLAESYLLSQLLLRPATKDEITMIVDQDKNPNLMVNNPATANTPKGTKTIAIVDLTGLAKIGRGEFVTASL